MNRFFLSILFALSLLVSCNSAPDYSKSMAFDWGITSYPSMIESKAELGEPEIVELDILQPTSLAVRDSILIVSSANAKGYWYFFDADNLSFLGNYIMKGRANNELLSCPRLYEQVFYDKGGNLYSNIYEFETGKIMDLNITETLKNKGAVAEKTDIGLPKQLFQAMRIGEGTYFCREVDPTHTMQTRFIYKDGKRTCPPYMAQLNESKVKPGADVNNLNAWYAYNKETKMFVEAERFLRHINIYTIKEKGNHMTLKHGDKLDRVDEIDDGNHTYNRFIAYSYLAAYKDFFVTLYQGDTGENVESGKAKKQVLHFFGWNGIPIMEVTLDRQITSFDIDLKRGFLYTVNYDTEEICRYDVKDILGMLN